MEHVYGTLLGWGAGLQRTLGGAGMPRQRRPAEKECRCPAELIRAARKEKMWKARKGGRRAQRKVSGFGQKWKVFLEKKPLPIQQLLPSLHLLPPVAPSSTGGPLALRSRLEVSAVNETAELFGTGRPSPWSREQRAEPFLSSRAIYLETNSHFRLFCLRLGSRFPMRSDPFSSGSSLTRWWLLDFSISEYLS